MSKYKEIVSMIEEKIVNGYYDEPNKLLTEDVLIKEYQSSSNTIRNAIIIYCGGVLLSQFKGLGNF